MITLTEQMIRDFGLTGAMSGEIATPEDIAIMNMNAAPQTTDPMSASLRPKIRPEAATGGQTVPTPPPVTGTKATAPTSAASGPFSTLSDDQRRLLRFAAIKDAGMALQGKEGNTVAAILGDFTKRDDMIRKANAAAALAKSKKDQGAALMSMLGMGGESTGGLEDKRQAVIMGMVTGAIEPQIGNALLADIERQLGVQKEVFSSQRLISGIDQLLADPALGQGLGIEGFLRKPLAELGLDEETARVRAKIDQVRGDVFLSAFATLKGGGQITELEGTKAEQAQARLSTAQSEEDFRDALNELKFYTELGIRRMRGEKIPETLYEDSKANNDPLGIRD